MSDEEIICDHNVILNDKLEGYCEFCDAEFKYKPSEVIQTRSELEDNDNDCYPTFK